MLTISGFAQAKPGNSPAPASQSKDPLMALPESDGVISVDVRRLLNEILPRVLADDQPKLAQVNARIDEIKTRTGIDVRTFENLAVGLRFVTAPPNSIKVEAVALARGQFNAAAVLSAGLLGAGSKYKYQQQKYGGKTIYVFNSDELFGNVELPAVAIDEETKKAGGKAAEVADTLLQKLLNFKGEIAIVALDSNTLAIGQPARVRSAIDAITSRVKVNAELIQLATQNPKAVVGFGANVPANASRFIGLDNDQITENLDSIRQVYGSVASTSSGFEMQSFCRTGTVDQAEKVYNMLVGFKDFGALLASNLSGDKRKLADSALENLQISKQGKDVQIRLALASADVAVLVRVFDKKN